MIMQTTSITTKPKKIISDQSESSFGTSILLESLYEVEFVSVELPKTGFKTLFEFSK